MTEPTGRTPRLGPPPARPRAGHRPASPGIAPAAAAVEVRAAVTERRTTFRRRHVLAEARRY
ncbi:hypothetical protein ACFW9F_20950, partial [Streptomyces sp. NPDC059506]|uniref:hypothetical protein n=1 Tax=Streptomyces sp. NPDC059506 TaxID=3347751 RepID=UPI003689DB54